MTSVIDSMTKTPAYDGQPAKVVELTNFLGSKIVIMDIGATWLSCELAMKSGQLREVLLGVATMEDFQAQGAFLGASIGRYANRIEHGQFSIGNDNYQATLNQAGNTLHGGIDGFDKRRWKITEQSRNSITMTLFSVDGDQGFPGNVTATVTYTLTETNGVEIVYQAETDKITPVNLTNHAYFNLQGATLGTTCLDHSLQIRADRFLPITGVGIPLGELADVSETGFDFRSSKQIVRDLMVDDQQKIVKGYDHAYMINPPHSLESPVALVVSPDNKVTMQVFTDKPAIQLYTGNFLAGTPNRSGDKYSSYEGFALETQFLPDSPNHPEWDQVSCLLKPGQAYCYTTRYQFLIE
jgi:aldose 1-epimerase